MGDTTTYRRHPDAVFTALGDEVVALQLGTKRYYTLNETAACAWRALEQCATAGAIEEALARDFAIDLPEARPHVALLVQELLRLRLIEPCAAGEAAARS